MKNEKCPECERLRAELSNEKAWSEDLAKQCCEMEDALGFKQECHGKHGEFIPTMGPWKERVRDLIAREAELVDAQAACAEMREIMERIKHADTAYGVIPNSIMQSVFHALSSSVGKGWRSPEEFAKAIAPTIELLRKIREFYYPPETAYDLLCNELSRLEKLTKSK